MSLEYVNTSASEFGAAIWGEQVVFSSARTDMQNTSSGWTGKANNQLFLATVGSNNYLESPIFLKNGHEDDFNVGPVAFSLYWGQIYLLLKQARLNWDSSWGTAGNY